MPTRGDRQLRAMQLAKQLAALGARLKTIHLITGMPIAATLNGRRRRPAPT